MLRRKRRSRFRIEDGRHCIDIRLHDPRQLFDLRDPSPFRQRDLDPGAVEHIMTSLREIPRGRRVRIVLFIAENPEPRIESAVLRDAIRGHFQHERDVAERELVDNFRLGRKLFAIGLGILFLLLSLSRLAGRYLPPFGWMIEVLKEGLVIMGWVAMWRPAEVLLYDWLPLYEKRRWFEQLVMTEVFVENAEPSVTPETPAEG